MMADKGQRSRVFLDVSIGTEPIGRLVFELFADKAPKTCENFRVLCTGEKPPLTYKGAPFHRIIDDFMIQGGDITLGNGRGGDSIYGGEFADENIGWRDIDEAGLLCMANHGKDSNSSQFFITLDECPHLNAKHTVFGYLVSGKDTLDRMAKVQVDKEDRPLTDVLVSHCGELERKKKARQPEIAEETVETSTSRGRHKRRHSSSRSRSPSPSRGHGRRSGSRHRHRHRRHKRDASTSASRSPTPPVRDRRRSDANPDHTFRGRQRRRSQSHDAAIESDEASEPKAHRKRSPPPSRPRSRDQDQRRQRSLPNQYRREDRRMENSYGRLGGGGGGGGDSYGRLGGGGGDSWRAGGAGDSGVTYKGRGAMKYREQKKRW